MRTGNKPLEPRSSLGAIQPLPVNAEEIKAAAWQDQGILIISRHDVRLGWHEAQMVKHLGERIYGKKKDNKSLEKNKFRT